MINHYIKKCGLNHNLFDLVTIRKFLPEIKKLIKELDKSEFELDENIYFYQVPRLSADGSCSLIEELEEEPYNLSIVLGKKTRKNLIYLSKLKRILDFINNKLKPGWIGIYKKFEIGGKDSKLVKLVYHGIPSRAEFPLTNEFATKSNNSSVGLTGKSIIINNIENHLRKGGVYYKCDSKVKSEVCLPIFDNDFSRVIGIVDVESDKHDFFDKKRISEVIALCIALSEIL